MVKFIEDPICTPEQYVISHEVYMSSLNKVEFGFCKTIMKHLKWMN